MPRVVASRSKEQSRGYVIESSWRTTTLCFGRNTHQIKLPHVLGVSNAAEPPLRRKKPVNDIVMADRLSRRCDLGLDRTGNARRALSEHAPV